MEKESGNAAQPADGRRKKVYLEALRILAILFILYQHQPAYDLFLVSEGPLWWIYTALAVFTRMNVPVFFMISGILLLGREESFGTLLRKRVLRHVLVITIFSGIYFILFAARGGVSGMSAAGAVWTFLTQVFRNTVEGSKELWFLYAYLGFLLMLPFLRRIAASGDRKDLIYLLVLRFVLFSVLPSVNLFLQLSGLPTLQVSEDFTLPLVMLDAFFFPLYGFLLERTVRVEAFRGKQLLILFAVLLFAVLDPVLFTRYQGQRVGEYTQDFILKYNYLIAGALFLLVKYLFTRVRAFRKKGFQNVVVFLGPLTFGIYLFDHLLKELLWAPYYLNAERFLPTLLMSAGWILISFVLCGAFTFVLKKIPGIRKLI